VRDRWTASSREQVADCVDGRARAGRGAGAWLSQRMVDDQLALPTPGTRIQFQPSFDFLDGKMRSGSGDAGHATLLETLHSLSFLSFSLPSCLERKLYER